MLPDKAAYEYPGYETGQEWTLEPVNLEGGDIRGRYKGLLRPQSWLIAWLFPGLSCWVTKGVRPKGANAREW